MWHGDANQMLANRMHSQTNPPSLQNPLDFITHTSRAIPTAAARMVLWVVGKITTTKTKQNASYASDNLRAVVFRTRHRMKTPTRLGVNL